MNTSSLPADLVEARQAAREHGVSYSTLRNWWLRGKLAKYQMGNGRVLVSLGEFERVMEQRSAIEQVFPPGPPGEDDNEGSSNTP